MALRRDKFRFGVQMQEFCSKKRFVVGITGASGVRLGIRFAGHLARFASGAEIFIVFSNGAKMVAQYEDKIADIANDSRLKNLLDSRESSGKSHKISRESKRDLRKDSSESNKDLKNLTKDLSQDSRDFHIDSAQDSRESTHNFTAKITLCDDSDLDSPISSGSFGVSATLIIPCSANTLAKIACGISGTLITRAALVALKERKTLLLAPREMPLNAIMLQNMLSLSQMGAIIAPPMLSYYANSENLAEMEDFMCGKWLDSLGINHNLFHRWGENKQI